MLILKHRHVPSARKAGIPLTATHIAWKEMTIWVTIPVLQSEINYVCMDGKIQLKIALLPIAGQGMTIWVTIPVLRSELNFVCLDGKIVIKIVLKVRDS